MCKKKINNFSVFLNNIKIYNENKIIKLINLDSKYFGILKLSDLKKNYFNFSLKLNILVVYEYDKIITLKLIKFSNFLIKKNKKFLKKGFKIKKIKIKEMKINYSIKNFDYFNKINKILYFFKKKYRVKIILIPKGREYYNKELKDKLINKISVDLNKYGNLQLPLKYINRNLLMVYFPKKK